MSEAAQRRPEVTVVMVPRERYSGILPAIRSLYEHTPTPFKLIVVEGLLPDAVRHAIETESRARNFTFVYKPYPLMPNEARNIGLAHADSTYVVFADNDILYTPNWLAPLVDSAEEFGAWLVGPTILDGDPDTGTIHAAAGNSGFEEKDGHRTYHFVPGHMQENLADVSESLKRGPVTMLEFHVLMARRDIFDTIGPLDEGICSFGDHDDLVMDVLNAGGPVIYEPASTVAYHDPGTNIHVLERGDLPFFFLRWSDEWNDASIERAAEKWGLDPTDRWVPHARKWARIRRRRAYSVAGLPGRFIGFVLYNVSENVGLTIERMFLDHYTRDLRALRNRHAEAKPLTHAQTSVA